jgi:thioredoxin
MRKISRWLPLCLLIPALTGCERLKAVAGKLAKVEKSTTASAAPAAPAAPVGQASYRSEQISALGKAGHAAFIARKGALVIVDFHADWCAPCKMLSPVLVRAAEAHPGVVYVGKVNVDQESALAMEQQVKGIPDVRIYKDGKEVDRFVGFPGEEEVLSKVATLSAGIIPEATGVAPTAKLVEQAVKPFDKDWLPPGMTRQKSYEAPKPQGSATQR